jgi:hypothetical protein
MFSLHFIEAVKKLRGGGRNLSALNLNAPINVRDMVLQVWGQAQAL